MRVEQKLHSMYSLKSSSGASKSGAIQTVPFIEPAFRLDLGFEHSARSKVATTFTLPSRNSFGIGRCRVPSGCGSRIAVKVLMVFTLCPHHIYDGIRALSTIFGVTEIQ